MNIVLSSLSRIPFIHIHKKFEIWVKKKKEKEKKIIKKKDKINTICSISIAKNNLNNYDSSPHKGKILL